MCHLRFKLKTTYHTWDCLMQIQVILCDRRVTIDLDQSDIELSIKQKIITENLKLSVKLELMLIVLLAEEFAQSRLETYRDDSLHLFQDLVIFLLG